MPVARIQLRSTKADFHLFLPVTRDNRFDPTGLSSHWPRAHGHWGGPQLTAEVDYEDDTVLLLDWTDGDTTSFELKPAMELKKGRHFRIQSLTEQKRFDFVIADFEVLAEGCVSPG